MLSWVLFNILIIMSAHGDFDTLGLALLINLVALAEYKIRTSHEDSEKKATVKSTRKFIKP